MWEHRGYEYEVEERGCLQRNVPGNPVRNINERKKKPSWLGPLFRGVKESDVSSMGHSDLKGQA